MLKLEKKGSLAMIILILSIFYAIYFPLIYILIGDRLKNEYNFGKASPQSSLPDSLEHVLVILSIPFGLMVIAGISWGFSISPHGDFFSINEFWIWSRSDMKLFFVFIMLVGLIFSFMVVYRLGEIKGINEMKNTSLFRMYLDRS
jgi:hypothetical protein